MLVQKWDPTIHLSVLGEWLRARGSAPDAGDASLYPPTGYLADGCAFGFLYTTNAPFVGYLDGLVTDPCASLKRKHTAVQALIVTLKHDAKMLGIRLLAMTTGTKGLARLSHDFGFRPHGNDYQYLTNYEE